MFTIYIHLPSGKRGNGKSIKKGTIFAMFDHRTGRRMKLETDDFRTIPGAKRREWMGMGWLNSYSCYGSNFKIPYVKRTRKVSEIIAHSLRSSKVNMDNSPGEIHDFSPFQWPFVSFPSRWDRKGGLTWHPHATKMWCPPVLCVFFDPVNYIDISW